MVILYICFTQVNPAATITRGAYTRLWELGDADRDRKRAAGACLGMLSPEELESLLDPELFHSQDMQRVRRSIAPEWPSPATPPSSAASVSGVERLEFTLEGVPIDRARLLSSIRKLLEFTPDQSWPEPHPRLFYGRVVAQTNEQGGLACMTFTLGQADVSFSGGAVAGVLLHGLNLCSRATVDWLKGRLLDCRPVLSPPSAPAKSFLELPESELLELQAGIGDDVELPDGIFHDGACYVSFEGARNKWHPAMAQLAEPLLMAHNERVAAANQQRRVQVLQYKQQEAAVLAH